MRHYFVDVRFAPSKSDKGKYVNKLSTTNIDEAVQFASYLISKYKLKKEFNPSRDIWSVWSLRIEDDDGKEIMRVTSDM